MIRRKSFVSISMALAVCLVIYTAMVYLPSEEKVAEGELSIVTDHSSNAAKAGLSTPDWVLEEGGEEEETKEEGPYTPNDPSAQFPPLSKFVQNQEIISDVSSLLDFYIIGFPKCGTTALKNYFARDVDEVLMGSSEICLWKSNHYRIIANLASELHDMKETSKHALQRQKAERTVMTSFKRAIKCPNIIFDDECPDCIKRTTDIFHKTSLIVALRHPIDFFRSYYNFRHYHKYPNFQFDDPNELIGPCSDETMSVCTDHARFHEYLAKFGKTNMTSTEELNLLKILTKGKKHPKDYEIPSKILLVEQGQMIDDTELFRQDLKSFLNLQYDLPPMEPPTRTSLDKFPDAEKREGFIDICEEKHKDVRAELLQNGKDAAQWIREFFMASEDVFVSSRDDFLERLKSWEVDPCDHV
mmetsp:Transcript_68372/g.101549  ORF Transcript_68372/g.101549 Transcript_68372/m.101549 type:complete len:414 (+) Transcript_68372:69-1310(+)